MTVRHYTVSITGKSHSALLMHCDSIEWADLLERLRQTVTGKKKSKAGDDRSPAWTWTGYVYNDGQRVVMPGENLARCMMEGGAAVPNGSKRGTFKAQTQSGMMVAEASWPLLVNGHEIPWQRIESLRTIDEFAEHEARASELGFSLFVKRARIGQAKHIRVRPKFSDWSCRGTIAVWDDQITEEVLRMILEYSGRYKGLGDWRPGAKTPGAFGTFEVTVEKA